MIFNLMDNAGGGGKATVTYTGTHTTEGYTLGGKTYTLYKITGSGTLSVKGRAKGASIWLCGGGANGGEPEGGAGAYCAEQDGVTLKGDYVVTIGAAQGATSFGTLLTTTAASGCNGGTGGGEYGGTGDGKSKYPFIDTSAFDPHCAGGGSGGGEICQGMESDYNYYVWSIPVYKGGTNGGDSSKSGSSSSGGAGGNRGGGKGGYKASGSSATFYGSGGGGGGVYYKADYGSIEGYQNIYCSGGSGYQGIVYVIIPA